MRTEWLGTFRSHCFHPPRSAMLVIRVDAVNRNSAFSGECEAENADDRDGRLSRVTIVLHFF